MKLEQWCQILKVKSIYNIYNKTKNNELKKTI
jgi:hypothetical protein